MKGTVLMCLIGLVLVQAKDKRYSLSPKRMKVPLENEVGFLDPYNHRTTTENNNGFEPAPEGENIEEPFIDGTLGNDYGFRPTPKSE